MPTEDKSKPESKKIDPIIATIAVAIIGFIATTIGSMVNNYNVNKLESRKFEFDLIKKGLEQPTEEERIKFLTFLSKLKLIKDYDMTKALDSVIVSPGEVPYLTSGETTIFKSPGTQPIKINSNATDKDYRVGALKAARGEVGQAEDVNAPNGGPAVEKYMLGGQGLGWTIGFISWCYAQNIDHKPPFTYAYSGASLKSELIKKGWWVAKGSKYTPSPGDIYLIARSNGSSYHGGIVDSIINESEFIGIEGNTSTDGSATGKMVAKKKRENESCGFGHIKQ